MADSFYEDNNILYRGTITRDFKHDISFANKTVPANICNPKHYSWLDCERSRKKVEYQRVRWGSACSFVWNKIENKLEFNPAMPKPKVIKE